MAALRDLKSDARTRAHSESCRETEKRREFRTKCFWSAMRPRIAFLTYI
jgi:hypothetical protein